MLSWYCCSIAVFSVGIFDPCRMLAGHELPLYYSSAERQNSIILFTFAVCFHSMLTGVHILLFSSISALFINAI